jgi:Zn-dependent peptidase ImmA (M78 family)
MRIPDTLKIGGHIVKIDKTDDMPTMSGNMGQSWNAYNSIKINTHFPESQQAITLVHEILHHLMSNLGYIYKKEDATVIHSEQTVEALAQGLFQVLRDNNLDFQLKGGKK